MDAILFPQPEVVAPANNSRYFYLDDENKIEISCWQSDSVDARRMNSGNVYLTRAEAEQREAWNAQQMARLVIPQWFRALGPDIEQQWGEDNWIKFDPPIHMFDFTPRHGIDFSVNGVSYRRDNFRLNPAPPDVVVNVNGQEYRWPAHPKSGEFSDGVRFYVGKSAGNLEFRVMALNDSCGAGNRFHLTRAGAESQLAALKAALGGV